MICVSIAEPTPGRCLEAMEGHDLAEIRLDGMKLTEKDIQRIFSTSSRLIATCRPGRISEGQRKRLLMGAIQAGASYVDVEIDSEDTFKRQVVHAARKQGCQVILSFHDYEKTPGLQRLNAIVARCFLEGADIAKIACKVLTKRDCARLLGLLGRKCQDRKLLVVGMGEKGKITRVVAPLLGSPFSYAAPSQGKETADGQITRANLEAIMGSIRDA